MSSRASKPARKMNLVVGSRHTAVSADDNGAAVFDAVKCDPFRQRRRRVGAFVALAGQRPYIRAAHLVVVADGPALVDVGNLHSKRCVAVHGTIWRHEDSERTRHVDVFFGMDKYVGEIYVGLEEPECFTVGRRP